MVCLDGWQWFQVDFLGAIMYVVLALLNDININNYFEMFQLLALE